MHGRAGRREVSRSFDGLIGSHDALRFPTDAAVTVEHSAKTVAVMGLTVLNSDATSAFPPIATAQTEPNGLLCAGGDLSPARLLDAYRHGIFPWFNPGEPILWWSPDPRCVFALDTLAPPRRLRQLARRLPWSISADRAFTEVMAACAEPRAGQEGSWIGTDMLAAFTELHRLGHAHSVEVWKSDCLIGGIYGVAVGRLFFGESMFSRVSGGSKLALYALAHQLHEWGFPIIDAQVENPHLLSLGAVRLPRRRFTELLDHYCPQDFPAGPWSERFGITSARAVGAWPGAKHASISA